jgi:hypothetical protein
LKPNLNLELKTLYKRNRKGIRKSREKKEMQPSRPNSAQLGRAPTHPRRLTGGIHLSAPTPSPARSLSLSRSQTAGADLSAPVSFTALPSSLSLSRRPGSPVAEPLPPLPPFLSLHREPSLSDPPSSRPPWIGECALVHVAGFLGHDARPRAQLPS